MSKFLWVNLNSTNNNTRILMEEGTQFENNGCKYTMTSNGLSIFNKENETTKIGDTIELKDYQYQVLMSVVDNCNDNKQVKALSNNDIKQSLKMHKNNTLKKDLATYLKGNYEIENPRRFSNENKISAYVTNGNKNTSGVLCFQHNVDKLDKNTIEIEDIDSNAAPSLSKINNRKNAFLGRNLFKHPAIIEKPAFTYTIKPGDSLYKLAAKYEIDTYQIIAANPQLKQNKDYKVTFYASGNPANISDNIKPGTKITIPSRYDVKKGSCKSIDNVAKITGVSKEYLYDFLLVVEPAVPRHADLTTYLDDGGTPTIGYGHTGRVDGKPLSMKHKITIDNKKALEILAEDILKHKAMTMAYLGKENFLKAPKSVQYTILDIAYNKGIWDGYLTDKGFAASTSKVKADLEKGHYASALVHSRRENTGFRGLRKRNIYRFISGLTDLPAEKRKAAMKQMEPYYKKELAKCKSYDRKALQNAWENAKRGITTGYTLK